MRSKKLFVLPFDHRGSFIKMFGYSESELAPEITARLAGYKHIIYEGFLHAVNNLGVPKGSGAILVDEQFGTKIQHEARAAGIARLLTVEKSGQDEFDFEYGAYFKEHINKFQPDYVKVLVRYNPCSEQEFKNRRQIARLKLLNNFCNKNGYRFLFELLAEPNLKQSEDPNFTKEYFEKTLRGEIMLNSIKELHKLGVEPDIWKLEGLSNSFQMNKVVEETRTAGRDNVGVVVLGRGESEEKVREWLTVASKIKGVVGLAVGRTVFKKPLLAYHKGEIGRTMAANAIAENYKGFVDIFTG
ncbi:MAG: DUF2090 domain-containing protein [Patescibacteria group bacterium]